MTEDLSTTTFEERQFFWDNRFQIEKRQSAEESLKMQEAVEKYWKYRSSLTGRIRHFLGIDKPEFKKNPRITEASPEEIQKENASFDFLSNCNSWAGVYKKFDDGLVYYTNEISVQGKSEEEIKYMQKTLQRYGINTQIDIAGSRENKDINASEIFVNLKHWQDNNATIKQGDTVLRITDPIGNQNLPDLFIFTRLPYTGHFIDVSFIPMTMEEYLKHEKRQQENDKLQEANANLSAYCNYLCSLLASSPDPNAVPQTVLEDEEQPNKRLRGESSDELPVFKPLEQSFGNSDGFASYEETNRLLDEYPYDDNDGFWDFVRNLYEESHPEEKDN